MKKIYLTLTILAVSFSAISQSTARYFDEKGKEISMKQFKKIADDGSFRMQEMVGTEDHYFLLNRVQKGKLDPTFHQTFKTAMKQVNDQVDYNEPIVVLYHPGVDECNKKILREEYKYLTTVEPKLKIVKKAYKNPILHIYKTADGLGKYIDKFSWTKDPNALVERIFFPHHYPCGSYVVVHPEGYYYAYLGEYDLETVSKAKYKFKGIIRGFGKMQ